MPGGVNGCGKRYVFLRKLFGSICHWSQYSNLMTNDNIRIIKVILKWCKFQRMLVQANSSWTCISKISLIVLSFSMRRYWRFFSWTSLCSMCSSSISCRILASASALSFAVLLSILKKSRQCQSGGCSNVFIFLFYFMYYFMKNCTLVGKRTLNTDRTYFSCQVGQ